MAQHQVVFFTDDYGTYLGKYGNIFERFYMIGHPSEDQFYNVI